jgi:ribosome maturation factor RimP
MRYRVPFHISFFYVTFAAAATTTAFQPLQQHQPLAFLSPQLPHARSTRLYAVLPKDYKDFGNRQIRQAASLIGVDPNLLLIEWKSEKIIVTVQGDVYASAPLEMEDDVEDDAYEIQDTDESEYFDNDLDDGAEDDNDQEEEDEDGFDETFHNELPTPSGTDLSALTRAITAILDDDGIGLAIAETHELEVTTPGASDVLSGIMFESYRGFDILCMYQDSKKGGGAETTIEGRLVERNDKQLILNIKGRLKKIDNDKVLLCKLPKALKEKGVL